MILSYLKTIKPEKYKPTSPKFNMVDPAHIITPVPVTTSIDWLTATNTRLPKFHDFVKRFLPLLAGHGFSFAECDRGHGNYAKAFQIMFVDRSCGFVCADPTEGSSNIGGMIVLSGAGCQLLQSRWDLWCLFSMGLMDFDFNLTRLDVAADFKGKTWRDYGFNILHMNDAVNAGSFSTGSTGPKPDVSLNGAFSELLAERKGAESYVPKKDAVKGCTINVGKGTSCSSWCIYEKGKQLAGKYPELCDDSMFDWVRVERRFSRGSGRSKKVVPFEFAVYPDEAIVYQCEGFKNLLKEWDAFRVSKGFEPIHCKPSDVVLERASLVAAVSFKKSVIHAGQQIARVARSLVMLNIDPMELINRVIHDKPVRGFCPDYHKDFTLDSLFPRTTADPCQSRFAF